MPRRKRQVAPEPVQLIYEKAAILRYGRSHSWFYRHRAFLRPITQPDDARKRWYDIRTIEALIACQTQPMRLAG